MEINTNIRKQRNVESWRLISPPFCQHPNPRIKFIFYTTHLLRTAAAPTTPLSPRNFTSTGKCQHGIGTRPRTKVPVPFRKRARPTPGTRGGPRGRLPVGPPARRRKTLHNCRHGQRTPSLAVVYKTRSYGGLSRPQLHSELPHTFIPPLP